MALSNGVPIEPSGASMSAPPSINAAATSTSSLLAAQCSGVSSPGLRALGSAPAANSSRTTCGPWGKKPGQSATTCRAVGLEPAAQGRPSHPGDFADDALNAVNVTPSDGDHQLLREGGPGCGHVNTQHDTEHMDALQRRHNQPSSGRDASGFAGGIQGPSRTTHWRGLSGGGWDQP